MRKTISELTALAKAGAASPPEPAVASVAAAFAPEGVMVQADEIGQRVRELLSETAAAVISEGGFIGHIKACVSFASGASLGLSIVKDRVRVTEEKFNGEEETGVFKLALTAIVYGPRKEELTNLLERGLAGRFPESLFARQPDLKPSPSPIEAMLRRK